MARRPPTAAPKGGEEGTAVGGRWIDYVPLDEIAEAHRNPKLHDRRGIRASVTRFGFVEPITIDERTGRLVAGHGRLEQLRAI
jgi:ParB-like chromosome segregation protein Spo0J